MKVSIITVSYNSAATIRDTFDSVLSQTYRDIEYIVVDGCSSDDTLNIVKEYAIKFNNSMRWVSEPDKGLYDAMNKGIQMATGDIIGFINSDDIYPRDNIISTIVECLLNNPEIESVYGDVKFVSAENSDKIVRYVRAKHFHPYRFRFGFMPPHPSFFTYHHIYKELGLFHENYIIAADYELLCRYLYKNNLRSKYLPLEIVRMKMGGKSTASLKSNYILNKEIVRACKENGIYTNMFLLSFKYIIKIFEFIFLK
ncbi:MAG: glycosyltransferase family 2 protein [Paludibacter sp.]|nr:glycosyltransferase family 2 protein [Paludibacter sp.]